jgi:hypothetical protein
MKVIAIPPRPCAVLVARPSAQRNADRVPPGLKILESLIDPLKRGSFRDEAEYFDPLVPSHVDHFDNIVSPTACDPPILISFHRETTVIDPTFSTLS